MTVNRRFVLGIDPGTAKSAFVVFDANHRQVELRRIVDLGLKNNFDLRSYLKRLDSSKYTFVIEDFVTRGIPIDKNSITTIKWIGIFSEVVGLDIHAYPAHIVRQWHCGHPSANDAMVSNALKEKYGEKGTKENPGFFYGFKSHIWQAFAVTAYHVEVNGIVPR